MEDIHKIMISSVRRRSSMESIAPINPVPTTWTHKDVVYSTREGKNVGETIVEATTYSVTVYDRNGNLQTVTNVHSVEWSA